MVPALPDDAELVFFKYLTSSRRWTDIASLDGQRFQQVRFRWDGPSRLAIGADHLIQGVAQHGPAFVEGFPFGNDFRPFDELSHIAARYFGISRHE